ncbi:hypothetical protein PIROE2DRAFT_17634 [Piromyces sp. E2]|nr:hypothetical protein PIROE2DRAFT_17634 [Piromyces sp. E2]|eukprot:OUM57401.1 hypothetical protein PIROE2DRAFT_17634 [Piromyces sp. E2]
MSSIVLSLPFNIIELSEKDTSIIDKFINNPDCSIRELTINLNFDLYKNKKKEE